MYTETGARVMPAGRPSEYKSEYCDTVVSLGRSGASKAEIAHALGVSRNTLDNWAAANPEFLSAVKEAVSLAQGWWESEGRKAVFGEKPGFNATAYIFTMKNRFPDDWKDKRETEISGDLNITTKEQRDAAVAAATRADR